ncbi:hypothetical protein [Nitrosomonas sp. ANs5]|uniref:hypothetical protein n=1 Tax=Nitrosomonas sp. ANs5 TaxID=3423941 RepID=UPI003D34970F
MKTLLSRIEKLEAANVWKPVLIIPSMANETQARQDYYNKHGYMPDRVIRIIRATHETVKADREARYGYP